MPLGFFTIEQWRQPKRGPGKWVAVCHVTGYHHRLSDAFTQLESLGKPGFYRIVQTQRMVLAEKKHGKLVLKKWHTSNPDNLNATAAAYTRRQNKT
jgi:hypothetical protein